LSSTKRKKLNQADGYVGILAADIHFPENGSLKDKRQHLRSLKAGLARKLGASVAEVGFHDLWQRSRLVMSLCSPSFPEINRSLDLAVRYLEERDLLLAGVYREIVKVEGEGMPAARQAARQAQNEIFLGDDTAKAEGE
jgi:uncharacterized protein YlxP (DUF503 family)